MHVSTSRRHYTAVGAVRELPAAPAAEAVGKVLAGKTLVEADTAFAIERALPHGDVACDGQQARGQTCCGPVQRGGGCCGPDGRCGLGWYLRLSGAE